MMTASRSQLTGVACLLLFVALLWLQPLATLSLGHQHDIPVHLRWATQFLAALREGWMLPRWASAARLGLGDPTFYYYQPLFYYISSAFAVLGARPERALILAAAVPFLLTGGLVYFYFLRAYANRYAILGTLFVVGCPLFFFMSVYLAAFPWSLSLPFSVLFIAESTRERPRPVWLGILLSLVCLSHLLSGLMTLLCTLLGRLIFAFPSRRTLPGHLQWALGSLLGLGLAAFFVYPAVTQLNLITPTGWSQEGGFEWRKGFALPTFSILKHGLYWFGIQWPLAVMALGMGVIGALQGRRGMPPLTLVQVRARRMAIIALAAIAFGSELAYPLYALLGPMQKIQFPYRFIFLACLLGNIAFVVFISEGAWGRWGRWMRAAALVLVAAQCAQAGFIQWGLHRGGERLPTEERFMEGNFGQPEYVPAVAGPGWKTYAEDGALPAECARLGLGCDAIRHRTHDFSVAVTAPVATSLRLPVFAFPAWRVSVDGVTQANQPDPATGLILAAVPAGRHVVTLAWTRLPAEIAGLWISALALLVLLGLIARARLRRGRAPVAILTPT